MVSVSVGHEKFLTGAMMWELADSDGLKQLTFVPNLIPNNGVQYKLGYLIGLASTSASSEFAIALNAYSSTGVASPSWGANGSQYIAVGTGAGTVSLSSVQLASELDRISSAWSQPAFNQWQEQSTFPTGRAVGALTEASNANNPNSNGGIMFAGTNFAVVNKLSGDTLTVTWTFTISTS